MPTEKIQYGWNLKRGTDTLNKAIDAANAAEELSIDADQKASEALSNSESTQEQLNTIVVEGDSSIEAAQARVDADGATTYPTLKARLDAEYTTFITDIRKIKYLGEYLNERVKSGLSISFKILGDSMAEGYGAIGHKIPSDNPIILTDTDGTVYRESNYTTKSYANLFRNYVINKLGGTFYKWGIGGKSAKWWLDRKHLLTSEDIIGVLLGTNDRTYSEAQFRANITELLAHIDSISNYMFVMSPPPLTAQSETAILTNGDINRIIKEVCLENGYPFISFYEAFLDFASKSSELTTLLSDGIHQNDAGFAFMWETTQDKFSLYNVEDYEASALDNAKVMPTNFADYARRFGTGSYVMPTNLYKNPIFDKWTDATTPEGVTKSAGLVIERITALFKGQYAAKLKSSSANSYVVFPLSNNTGHEKTRLLVTYEAQGVTRAIVYQNGNTTALADVFLVEGTNTIEIPLEFNPANTQVFNLTVYPDVTLKGGYCAVDSIVAIKEKFARHGYFTDERRVLVDWFNLKGDGTDESALITAMIQHMGVSASSAGYTLKFGRKSYTFSGLANLNKKIIVEGDGIETNLSNAFPNALYKNIAVAGVLRNDIIVRREDGTQAKLVYNNDGTVTTTPFSFA